MSSNPIGNGYQSPVPPWTPQSSTNLARQGQPCGQQLFDDVTEFYSWYISSWYMASNEPSSSESSQKSDATRKILSLIKRVAEVSMSGGNFLSDKEESKAVDALSDILQDLNSGRLRKQDLPEALQQVMTDLTNDNPKAKVVFQTTELEYRLCINPAPGQSKELTGQYQQSLSLIIERITPEMRDINASAIAQGLSQILDNPETEIDISGAINKAVKDWI
ncbi:MAG: hypothetical protein JSS60_01250 [Verrucomicrobia bacterium]|nr:hypothetical protein [Verrucomicrobiota bacterium]